MIFQSRLPYDVFQPRALPGILPLGDLPWLMVDDAYAPQMAHRRTLTAKHPDRVLATADPSTDATQDMLDEILSHLPDGFDATETQVTCPDGVTVPVNRSEPFHTLSNILQEDVCLLEKRGKEHVLTGASLCFPASWRLAEKIGHPLTHIHDPVDDYTDELAKRVQRLFDGVRAGRAIWRFNALWYEDPELHQPRSAANPRPLTEAGETPYLRSERQVIWRLPKSNAVLFTNHTYVIPRDRVKEPFRLTETA
ncbi:DUF3445 domain-containing protein [Marivita sp. S6314]|uniref:heme-dependent oxidative N-demethylase family protein n=1 Tax=Marivita sp. S6314 TaxID=2926406 RepID=UPI001FF5B4AA|nr:DUF3445 domain-containing protein [Marivita sp. S6314]MCK0150992.1 DUF3445 domain-containing protein [Marivita sp. S6314]